MSFKTSKNLKELINWCSTVKYDRENIRRITKAYMTIYSESKSVTTSHVGFTGTWRIIETSREKSEKFWVFRKPLVTNKVKPVKALIEDKIIKKRTLKKHLDKYREGYLPSVVNKFQLLIKFNCFKEGKFRLFIQLEYSVDYNRNIDFKYE